MNPTQTATPIYLPAYAPPSQAMLVNVQEILRSEIQVMDNLQITDKQAERNYILHPPTVTEKGLRFVVEYGKHLRASTLEDQVERFEFDELIGKQIVIEISRTGRMLNHEGLEDLPAIENFEGTRMSADEYLSEIRTLFVQMPNLPLQPGETWRRAYAESATNWGLTVETQREDAYHFEETDGTLAIQVDGQGSFAGSGVRSMGPFKTKGQFDAQSFVQFDVPSGFPTSITHHYTNTGHVFAGPNDEMSLPIKMTQTLHILLSPSP